MKKYLFVVVLMILPISGIYAQLSTEMIDLKLNLSSEWQELFSSEGILIEYRLSECDPEMGFDDEKIILRATNNTNESKFISWHAIKYFGDYCTSCDYEDEYTFSVKLKANESQEGGCSIYADHNLNLFVRFKDDRAKKYDPLTKFQLAKINIQ